MPIRNKTRLFIKNKNLKNITIPILFIFTFLLVFFNKTDYLLIEKVKTNSIDFVVPVTKIVSYPITITIKTINNYKNLQFIEKENNRLKQEIIRLKKWQKIAIKNINENNAYKKLLNSTNNDLNVIKTASTIQHSPKFYTKSIIINAGLNHNIGKNYAVINERGLVGKTILVTKTNSKVLLILDQNSSVPVKSYDRDFNAILKGSADGKYLVSSFIKNNQKPLVGDILVTSGNVGIFPANILVGKVVKILEDQILALPFVDTNDIKFVQVINNN